MINGQITIQGFQYQVADGEANKIVNGQPTDEKIALKILSIKDGHSQLAISFIFSQEEFEQFIATLDNRRIIAAPLSAWTRNGGIRQ